MNAPAGTSQMTVSITDSSGNPVTSFNVTPAVSGMTYFQWNGATSAGTTAPAGNYTVAITATVDGKTQQINPNLVNKVSTVTLDPTSQAVDLNTDTGNTVPLSSVVSVM